MREISSDIITETVRDLCIKANCVINNDIKNRLCESAAKETSETAREILEMLCENAEIAKSENVPICQDTGMAIIFIKIGQDVHVTGSFIEDAVNEGVRQGYTEGYLRKSVVADPILRGNTGDNTPAVIHYEIVKGDKIEITVAPKGFGSENMSKVFMLKPSDGIEGIKNAVIKTVCEAGSNPCPPIVIGIGIGGDFEKAAILAKKALLRETSSSSEIPHIKKLEEELLQLVNKTGIGAGGLGGDITAFGVNIETYPTHIAGMPLAVNISCHVTRHETAVI